MSWFSDLLDKIKGEDAVDFVVTPPLGSAGGPGEAESLEPDACYVEVFVDSLRIPRSRRLNSIFYGAVHSFSSLERLGEGRAKFAAVTTPSELAKADPASLGRVVTVTKRVMGPVPWRGGDLGLEIGLFSVKAQDLTSPFLEVMSTMSESAGVSFVSAAAPFVPVIRKGMELLTGKDGAATLEIGLDSTVESPKTGVYALLAVARERFDPTGLSVDPNDRKLLKNGQPVTDVPYIVFRIAKSKQRADFGSIPDLGAAYRTVTAAIRSNKRQDAEEAFRTFRLATLTSPDLIPSDAAALVGKVEQLLKDAFAGVMQSRGKDTIPLLPALGDIKLYSDR